MGKWNANSVPNCPKGDCSEEVLVTVKTKYGNNRVLRAVYFGFHAATVEDMCWNMPDGVPDDWEYYEEQDSWWVPEGWYEVADYHEEYEYFTIDDRVTAWMKMPKAYESSVKDFAEVKGEEK